jgi:hypothetical protein
VTQGGAAPALGMEASRVNPSQVQSW